MLLQPIIIQLFYSETLLFTEEKSYRSLIDLDEHGNFSQTFSLPRGSILLRLDIGEYFSLHKNFEIKIESPPIYTTKINLTKDLIGSNQFSFDSEKLICGFDSYCIFTNQYFNKPVKIAISSTIVQTI